MLNLIVENQAEIPIFMQAANGNQSDQTAFRSIVCSHVGELRNWSGIEYMVADSALYSEATLQALADKHLFITRVLFVGGGNHCTKVFLKASILSLFSFG